MLASSIRQASTIVVIGQRPSSLQLLTAIVVVHVIAKRPPFAGFAAVLSQRNPG